jgi:hypothetical protein
MNMLTAFWRWFIYGERRTTLTVQHRLVAVHMHYAQHVSKLS